MLNPLGESRGKDITPRDLSDGNRGGYRVGCLGGKRMLSRAKMALTILVIGASVSGCGFRLSTATAPPFALTIPAQPDAIGLKTRLQELGGAPVSSSAYGVRIRQYQRDKRPLSFSGDTRALEYELSVAVVFDVAREGDTLLADQEITEYAHYRRDARTLLGSADEERTVFEELDRVIAGRIVHALTASGRQSASEQPQAFIVAVREGPRHAGAVVSRKQHGPGQSSVGI